MRAVGRSGGEKALTDEGVVRAMRRSVSAAPVAVLLVVGLQALRSVGIEGKPWTSHIDAPAIFAMGPMAVLYASLAPRCRTPATFRTCGGLFGASLMAGCLTGAVVLVIAGRPSVDALLPVLASVPIALAGVAIAHLKWSEDRPE